MVIDFFSNSNYPSLAPMDESDDNLAEEFVKPARGRGSRGGGRGSRGAGRGSRGARGAKAVASAQPVLSQLNPKAGRYRNDSDEDIIDIGKDFRFAFFESRGNLKLLSIIPVYFLSLFRIGDLFIDRNFSIYAHTYSMKWYQ